MLKLIVHESLKVKNIKIFLLEKKRKRFSLEPDTKHFCFAVERDSTLSVVYLRARVDIGRETLREAGRGKARRAVQPAKKEQSERERGIIGIYIGKWVPRDCDREIREAEERRKIGKKEEPRNAKREIAAFIVENAFHVSFAKAVCLRNSRTYKAGNAGVRAVCNVLRLERVKLLVPSSPFFSFSPAVACTRTRCNAKRSQLDTAEKSAV